MITDNRLAMALAAALAAACLFIPPPQPAATIVLAVAGGLIGFLKGSRP